MVILGEIIRELTKAKWSVTITSENVLTWAKRVEAHRAQSARMSTLTEVNEFDKLKVAKYAQKDTAKRTTQTWTPTKQISDIVAVPTPKTMPGIWEDVYNMQQSWPLLSSM